MWKKGNFFLLESNVKLKDLNPSQKVENNTHLNNIFTNFVNGGCMKNKK